MPKSDSVVDAFGVLGVAELYRCTSPLLFPYLG